MGVASIRNWSVVRHLQRAVGAVRLAGAGPRGRVRTHTVAITGLEELEARLFLSATHLITEFMASNSNTITDVDGDHSD